VGAAGGVVSPRERGQQPFHTGGIEGHVDFDGGVAGDRGGDAGAGGFEVVGLRGGAGLLKDFKDHALQFCTAKAGRRGFDGDGVGAEGLGFAAVAFQLRGERREDHHLLGEQVDQHRHKEALAFDALSLALAEDFFEEHALVGDMLIDDPEAFVVGGEDEGLAQLAEGFERGKGVEGGCGLAAFPPHRANTGRAGGPGVGEGWFGAGVAVGGGGWGSGARYCGGEGEMDFFGARLGWGEVEGRGVAGLGRSVGVGDFRDRLRVCFQNERRGSAGAIGESLQEAGGGAGLHQRNADAFADEVVDEGLLAEADLGFGGVDVDVDFVGRHFEKQEDDRERGGRDDVAIGLDDGVNDEAIADEALVDEDVDRVSVELLQRGAGDEAAEAEEAGIGRGVVAIAAPGRRFGEAGVVEAALGGEGE